MNYTVSAIKRCLRKISRLVKTEMYDINYGGCGIYAVELAKRMHEIGATDAKIRCYGGMESITINTVEQNFNTTGLPNDYYTWVMNGVDFNHVRMEWEGIMWDAEGDLRAGSGDAKAWNGWCRRQNGDISVKAMQILADKPSNWNSRFDRTQIPKLRSIMDTCFAELRAKHPVQVFAIAA